MGGSDVVEVQYHDAFSGKRSISPSKTFLNVDVMCGVAS